VAPSRTPGGEVNAWDDELPSRDDIFESSEVMNAEWQKKHDINEFNSIVSEVDLDCRPLQQFKG